MMPANSFWLLGAQGRCKAGASSLEAVGVVGLDGAGVSCSAEVLDSDIQQRAGRSKGLGRRGHGRIWAGETMLGRRWRRWGPVWREGGDEKTLTEAVG